VGGIDVSNEEVAAEAERFAGRFADPATFRAFLRRFDISEMALRDMLRRDLRNAKFIEQRLRAWRVGSDDSGAQADQQNREWVARWLKELRGAVELRLVGPTGELEQQ